MNGPLEVRAEISEIFSFLFWDKRYFIRTFWSYLTFMNTQHFQIDHLPLLFIPFILFKEINYGVLTTKPLEDIVQIIPDPQLTLSLQFRYYMYGILLPKLFDLLWEKKCSIDWENFWNSRLKAENLQNLWDHENNLSLFIFAIMV